MELEETGIGFTPAKDPRPMIPEPPPVRLVAIEDVHVPAGGGAAGLEKELDGFYVRLLKFVREGSNIGHITYKSENWRLCFDVKEPPVVRADFRPVGIEVPSLLSLERDLIEQEIEYQWQKSLLPGQEVLLLQDPAGNWVQVGQFVRV
ncbi:MAG TPA: hypothetical protein VHY37_09960 [Tepidisphaeraceae bacterium]|jgi:hypothetical protein|nr:hypothetical protein [Tepidisphaeraceae bacterium]